MIPRPPLQSAFNPDVTLTFSGGSTPDRRPSIHLQPEDCSKLWKGYPILVEFSIQRVKLRLYMMDILKGDLKQITYSSVNNKFSKNVFLKVVSTGLLEKVSLSGTIDYYIQEFCTILERISLPALVMCSHSKSSHILGAISQGKTRIKKLALLTVLFDIIPDITTMITSPMTNVEHVLIVNIRSARFITDIINMASRQTWLFELELQCVHELRDDLDIQQALSGNYRLNTLLRLKHQLFLFLCSQKRRKCAISKLPVELIRMLSTFLIN